MSGKNTYDEMDLTDPLRAGIYSLAFMLWDKEGDLPSNIVELIEDIVEQERNSNSLV